MKPEKRKCMKSTGGKAPRKRLSLTTIRMQRQLMRQEEIAAKSNKPRRPTPSKRKQLTWMSDERRKELERIQKERDRQYRRERNIPDSDAEDQPVVRLERVKIPEAALRRSKRLAQNEKKPLRRSKRIAEQKSKEN